MSEKSYLGFTFRKVHSLLGIIPLGLFLLEHLLANSTALFGKSVFAQTVNFLTNIPFLGIIETLFIFLPLIIHGIMGLIIVFQAENNYRQYSYLRNWMFYFQRISGLVMLTFIFYHLFTVKFTTSGLSFFEILNSQLANPLILTFYIVALISASFHFCNGLWGFLINWGLLVGPKAQKSFGNFVIGLFVLFNILWLRVMMAFL